MAHYTVEFRITTEDDVHWVTDYLQRNPSQLRSAGKKHAGRINKFSLWAYGPTEERGGATEFSTLESALERLMDDLEQSKPKIQKLLKENVNLIWWCGCFQIGINHQILLPIGTMSRLLTYGGDLAVDVYS